MPLSYSEEGEQLADKSPCAEIRARLKMCLLDSDCCKKVNIFYIYIEKQDYLKHQHTHIFLKLKIEKKKHVSFQIFRKKYCREIV